MLVFFGWFDLGSNIFGYSNNLKIRGGAYVSQKLDMKIFFFFGGGGLIIGPGIFGGCVGSPRDFCEFLFLPPFDHPHHLKSGVPLPAPPRDIPL